MNFLNKIFQELIGVQPASAALGLRAPVINRAEKKALPNQAKLEPEAVAKPVEPRVDWKFIGDLEGFRTSGYVPTDNEGNPLDSSGVTVATGFDIGQWSERDIRNLGLSEELTKKLLPYSGLKRKAAVTALQQFPLKITEEEALEINNAVKTDALNKLAQDWQKATGEDFAELDPAKQTVVASVAFQYGDLPSRTPRFWKHVTSGKWGKAIEELRDFGDKYTTRRNKEADYLTIALK